MAHQSKTESLKEALKAADDEISHQKSLNTQLETEVGKFFAYLLFNIASVVAYHFRVHKVRQILDKKKPDLKKFDAF